jgi:hypothetical protein
MTQIWVATVMADYLFISARRVIRDRTLNSSEANKTLDFVTRRLRLGYQPHNHQAIRRRIRWRTTQTYK